VAENLPPSSAEVTESGSLKLPEPSGPLRPVMGLLYLYRLLWKLGSKQKDDTRMLKRRDVNSYRLLGKNFYGIQRLLRLTF
jgi:hypothetical protein